MTDSQDRVLGMLGLAARAGRVVGGSSLCEKAVREGKVLLLLTAGDLSPKTEEPLLRLCGHKGVPVIKIADMERLGKFTGKSGRAAVGITDRRFADRILELAEQAADNGKH